jgi:glycosyltransferase involved in cell wall biosynthesis
VACVPHVRRVLKSIKPHVLLSYYVTGYGTLGSLTGFHPIVQVTSGSDVLLVLRNPLLKRLVRFNLAQADLVTSWAPHMARAAQELGATEDRTLVLPRGIPFRHFANARRSSPRKNGFPRIISTRSLKSDYNLDLLLRALQVLRESGFSFSLTLAGDGPERSGLVALSRQLGLEHHVQFVGFVPNEKLPSVLAEHDLYVSLVDSDGVSASLLEAMAVGLLPIVPDHPANRTWIKPGKAGLLLDDLSPRGVARVIARALTDLPLRRQAWAENSEIVRNGADLYRNAELFVDRFRQLVAEHSS